jgi:hypothetical protein
MSMVPPGFAEGDIPGIGASVAAGEGFAVVFDAGVGLELGAGVLIGIPGIGPMVGCAARTGVTDAALSAAARTRGRANNGNLVRASTYYAP